MHLGGARKHHAFAVVHTWPQMSPRSKSNQSLETSRMCSVLGGTRKHRNFCDSRNCYQAPAGEGVCHPPRATRFWYYPPESGSGIVPSCRPPRATRFGIVPPQAVPLFSPRKSSEGYAVPVLPPRRRFRYCPFEKASSEGYVVPVLSPRRRFRYCPPEKAPSTPSLCVSGRSPKTQLRESRETMGDRAASHHVQRQLACP